MTYDLRTDDFKAILQNGLDELKALTSFRVTESKAFGGSITLWDEDGGARATLEIDVDFIDGTYTVHISTSTPGINGDISVLRATLATAELMNAQLRQVYGKAVVIQS